MGSLIFMGQKTGFADAYDSISQVCGLKPRLQVHFDH